jgi:uncharacterized membrane protein (UPF0127 family)
VIALAVHCRRRIDHPGRARGRVFGSLALSLSLVVLACGFSAKSDMEPEAWVEIKGKRIAVEVADTPRKQEKGLGERDRLAWDKGMYFEYAKPAFYAFWMKGMRFSIDIVWLRGGRIVDLHSNVPFEPGGNGPTVRPSVLVDAVLEVPAGTAVSSGWQIGDPVLFERVRAQ